LSPPLTGREVSPRSPHRLPFTAHWPEVVICSAGPFIGAGLDWWCFTPALDTLLPNIRAQLTRREGDNHAVCILAGLLDLQ
jgi:hypothetical protein